MSSRRVPSSQHAIPRNRRRAPSQTFLLLTRMQEVVHQQGDQGDREKHHQRHDQDMEKCNHGRFLLCSIDLPEAGPAGPTMSVHEAARVSQPVSAPLPIQHAPSERAARGLRLDRAAGPFRNARARPRPRPDSKMDALFRHCWFIFQGDAELSQGKPLADGLSYQRLLIRYSQNVGKAKRRRPIGWPWAFYRALATAPSPFR